VCNPGCRRGVSTASSSRTFDAKGVLIHYLVQGNGEAVVLIHGLYSSAAINWEAPGIVAALARDHEVIALDLPGHGRSDKPDDPNAYGRQMMEDVVLLLDHLKLRRAHIVGYSMGGMVALKLVAEHPDRVVSAVLGGMGWLREGGGLQRLWEHLPMGPGRSTPAVCVTSIGELALSDASLRAITTPVIVVVGDRDPVRGLYVVPLQAVRRDWPVITIDGAGHLNCILKPQFKDEIVKWVDDHRARS